MIKISVIVSSYTDSIWKTSLYATTWPYVAYDRMPIALYDWVQFDVYQFLVTCQNTDERSILGTLDSKINADQNKNKNSVSRNFIGTNTNNLFSRISYITAK